MPVRDEVCARLREMGVPFVSVTHLPVRTMEDCAPNAARLGALMPKNLFLTPRNESAFVLCIVRPDVAFRTADVSKQLGLSRLSFASAERLRQYLRTEPGAISPMGLLFDEARAVRLAVDAALWDEPVLAFHPCVPTETLALAQEDFRRFLREAGYTAQTVRVGE